MEKEAVCGETLQPLFLRSLVTATLGDEVVATPVADGDAGELAKEDEFVTSHLSSAKIRLHYATFWRT